MYGVFLLYKSSIVVLPTAYFLPPFITATYYFKNEAHKKQFEANPDKYAPQHGGFCAFGVSKGGLFPVDVTTADVYKGKLYLNLNHDMVVLFNKDKDGAIAKADENFLGLVEKHGI
jgi:hypothetical protein